MSNFITKSRIFIGLLILFVFCVASVSYHFYTENLRLKTVLIKEICNNLAPGDSLEKVNSQFSEFYSKPLTPNTEGSDRFLYGLSESQFDPFCVVTYGDDDMVMDSGYSFD